MGTTKFGTSNKSFEWIADGNMAEDSSTYSKWHILASSYIIRRILLKNFRSGMSAWIQQSVLFFCLGTILEFNPELLPFQITFDCYFYFFLLRKVLYADYRNKIARFLMSATYSHE